MKIWYEISFVLSCGLSFGKNIFILQVKMSTYMHIMRCRYDLVIAKQLNNKLNLLILFMHIMRCRYDLVIAKQLNNKLNLLILFIISKIKNERFDEEEINELTSR